MAKPTKERTMSWLTSKVLTPSSDYDANECVEKSIHEYGVGLRIALNAWDEVDPLHCAYTPDEYLGYAERFVKSINATLVNEEDEVMRLSLVAEHVRRSFHASQTCYNPKLKRPWVSSTDIVRIAREILEAVRKDGLKLEDLMRRS
jgi:hypothetical protein